ncbi:MAG: hypothetical protein IT423_02170 [Pirellulaceae bacterium]|nr:hypothetical protein [Pirellulaceae bacterium]
MAKPRFRIQHILVLTAVIAVFITVWLAIQNAIATRTIVAIDLPAKKRVRVIQTFGGEPFDTKVYFDAGDGQWGFYYYEHEDWYWNKADVQSDGETISIMRGGRSTIQLNTQTGACIVERLDGQRHEYKSPVYYTNSLPGSNEP